MDDILGLVKEYGDNLFARDEFLPWCKKNILLPVGGKLVPFSIDEYPFLYDIYTQPDVPLETYQKAAQMGISTYALLKTFFRLTQQVLKGVYYFPTDEDVKDFAQDRANPLIDNNPYLSKMMSYDKADNLGLKQIGKSSLYFRGVWSKRKVKSVDADLIVKDEVDEANQENLVFADDRLLHSAFKWNMELSQPSRKKFGINRSFLKSDQQYYLIKCACGRDNNVVEDFPNNLGTRGKGEKLQAAFVCPRCKRKLDMRRGRWVAKHPHISREHVGRLLSNIYNPTVSALHIYKRFSGAKLLSEKKNFSISLLGVPYHDPNLSPVSDELISSCEHKGAGFERSAYSSFMGIDVGDMCHVSIWGYTGSKLRLLHCEEVPAMQEERFRELIERYHSYFVIDAMPYKTLSKNLCLRYKGYGSIQYFKGDSLKERMEGEGDVQVPVVQHNRNESIEDMVSVMQDGFFMFPDPHELDGENLVNYEKFKDHLMNLEKDEIKDNNGYTRFEYKKKVENHFGMSMNSAFIAFQIGKGHFVPTVRPVFG